MQYILSSPARIDRLARAAVTAGMSFLFFLIIFGNLTDYGSNFAYIQHVMSMDTTLPGSAIRYRAVTSPLVHHALYWVIIVVEILALALSLTGAIKMARRSGAPGDGYIHGKSLAIAGLTLAYLLWQVAIFSVGNEWFGMWMSKEWNGIETLFRILMINLGALIYVSLPERRGP